MDITIPRRYCGPPESANGGWASGVVAERVRTSSERPVVSVRLASPPPLDRRLSLAAEPPASDVDEVRLLDGDHLVATATAAPAFADDVAAAPTLAQARAAEQRYEGLVEHPFPTCFVCGTARDPADALCLRPGPLDDGTGRYAASWVPHDVGMPLVWAALDCPGGWSAGIAGRPMVLGTMAAHVLGPPVEGEPHVVVAWQRGSTGRRHLSGTALLGPDGALLARAEATWVAVDPTTIRPQDVP